jgi:hypothetical protein
VRSCDFLCQRGSHLVGGVRYIISYRDTAAAGPSCTFSPLAEYLNGLELVMSTCRRHLRADKKNISKEFLCKGVKLKGVRLGMISLNRHAALTSYSEKAIDLSD